MKILVIGDIIGRSGRVTTRQAIAKLREQHDFDFVIANGENMAHGLGMTPKTYEEMREAGVDFFTTGNHIHSKPDIFPLMEKKGTRIIRPANFPPGNLGKGYQVVSVGKQKLLIVNLMGRVFMSHSYDCPFRKMDEILDEFAHEPLDGILVDFHAEATSEKIAMKHYLDGRVSALWGTHTHVATADAEISPQGIAYITDLGMVGPMDSVIGVEKGAIIESFLRQTHFKFECVPSGICVFSAILLNVSARNRCDKIQFIQMKIDV